VESEISKYVQQRNAEEKYLMEKLGLTKEEEKD
jgi:hypothetical protein